MIRICMILQKLARDTRGQDIIEYALLLALVATATGASFPAVAGNFSTIFSRITSLATNAAG